MVDAEKKQTMSPEHVLHAIQQLEFHSWQADLTSTISEFKIEAKGEPQYSNLGEVCLNGNFSSWSPTAGGPT